MSFNHFIAHKVFTLVWYVEIHQFVDKQFKYLICRNYLLFACLIKLQRYCCFTSLSLSLSLFVSMCLYVCIFSLSRNKKKKKDEKSVLESIFPDEFSRSTQGRRRYPLWRNVHGSLRLARDDLKTNWPYYIAVILNKVLSEILK